MSLSGPDCVDTTLSFMALIMFHSRAAESRVTLSGKMQYYQSGIWLNIRPV